MNNLGLVLLCFCFKNLDFLAIQIAHIDFRLTTLFVIVTFFEPIFFVLLLHFKQYVNMFYTLVVLILHFKQYVCILYVLRNTYLKNLRKKLCIVLLFFSNSNANSTNPFLMSSIRDFSLFFGQFFSQFFSRYFNMPPYLIHRPINTTVYFIKINPNGYVAKFLFY